MKTLDRYEILEELGHGGFAIVYKGRDPDLDRLVALKVLAPRLSWDATFARRFRQEAQATARLGHPNIVVIHEVGEDDEQLYIAMEYVPGQSLAELMEAEGALPFKRALPILVQVARALDYAHAEGVLHRDVKPSNIMVTEGRRGQVYVTLTDFGLVKALESSESLTSMGAILGSPEYMAPEQSDPDRADEIGPATDNYALGVVAYEMLVGRVPFPGSTPSTLVAHMLKEPPDPQSIRGDLPPEVTQVLLKALAKQPEDRYPTAGELVQALRLSAEAGQRARKRDAEPATRVKEEELEQLYGTAQARVRSGSWAEALDLCEQVQELEPGYRDVDGLLAAAREGLRREQEQEEEQAREAAVQEPAPPPVEAPVAGEPEPEAPGRRRWRSWCLWLLALGLLAACAICSISVVAALLEDPELQQLLGM